MYDGNSKRAVLRKMRNEVLFQSSEITITKEINGEYTFQIGNIYTSDVLEAVAILMRNSRWSDLELWDLDIRIGDINTIMCIYWLSGGDEFWHNPDCRVEWFDAYPILVDKYEDKLHSVRKKKTLRGIRKHFIKHFNLDTFYDFALSKDII